MNAELSDGVRPEGAADAQERAPEPRLEQDLVVSRRFLDLLDPLGVFTFQTFSDREELKRTFIGHDGKRRQYDPFAKVFHGTLDEHAAKLVDLNQHGVGAFVMVNEGDGVVHKGTKTCRLTANVTRVRAVFVDLDGSPIAPVLTGAVQPDWAVQSSLGRWHAYWKVTNCPLGEFTAAQIALATKFNGDASIQDLPRVMRIPGFLHQKGTPFVSQLYLPDDYPRLLENSNG